MMTKFKNVFLFLFIVLCFGFNTISSAQPLPKQLIPKGKPQLILLEFTAPWCLSCKKAKPVLAQLQKQYGPKLAITHINVEEAKNQKWVNSYHIEAIPTFIFYNNKLQQKKRIETELTPDQLKKQIMMAIK